MRLWIQPERMTAPQHIMANITTKRTDTNNQYINIPGMYKGQMDMAAAMDAAMDTARSNAIAGMTALITTKLIRKRAVVKNIAKSTKRSPQPSVRNQPSERCFYLPI